MIDDKTIDKARKLQAMAEGGEDHEATVAREMLAAMLDRHGLTLDDLAQSATASVTIVADAGEGDESALPERRVEVVFETLDASRREIARQVLLHMPRGREVDFLPDPYEVDVRAMMPESMAALAVTMVELAFKAYDGTLTAMAARHERERNWLLIGFLDVNGLLPHYSPSAEGDVHRMPDDVREFRARLAAKDDCYSITPVARLMPCLLPPTPSPDTEP